MLIVMQHDASESQIALVNARIAGLGLEARPIPSEHRLAIGVIGNQGPLDPAPFRDLPGVADAIPVTSPYKQVSREWHAEDTVITLANGQRIGGGGLCMIAGPCGVESREQLLTTAERVAKAGARVLRGGAFKPRTSPYAFQGLGEAGLKLLAEAREAFGLAIITEAIDHESLELVEQYADIIQLGARNMQNFSLLRRAGRSNKPVMLKRGPAATIKEWLLAAEYILAEGNPQVILCERGIRAYDDATRNTLDVAAIPLVKRLSHLPVIADPSHATGRRALVAPAGLAAVAAGADGLIVEVHCDPDSALSDGGQSLYPDQFDALMTDATRIAEVLGKRQEVTV
ncbi:MAG: 3-deoxy-7-phosphoheptulonate synthase [Candidatus Sericytochromatia bacterium]